MYTITKGPSKLVAQRRTGAQGGGGYPGWVLEDPKMLGAPGACRSLTSGHVCAAESEERLDPTTLCAPPGQCLGPCDSTTLDYNSLFCPFFNIQSPNFPRVFGLAWQARGLPKLRRTFTFLWFVQLRPGRSPISLDFLWPPDPAGLELVGPVPLKTLLFILVPFSAEEEPRAAVGHLSPGWRAGRRDRECLAEWHVQPRTPGSHLLLPGPRLVFNRVNGRRPPTTSPSLEGTQETYTLAHEENVRFVSEAWQQVEQQLGGGPAGESGPRPVQYVERTPNPRLQNFVPIDLDEWWAQQFLARITNCS
nr:PREDICTED: protein FAM195A [Equus przewalskii]